ncbi:MAG: hypothetical protein ACRDB1_11320 [Microcoleaceae cyanobacterium]
MAINRMSPTNIFLLVACAYEFFARSLEYLCQKSRLVAIALVKI